MSGTETNDTGTAHDPRGSLWHRWDPHVHLPGTLFEDAFDPNLDVSAALDLLALRTPSIEAIGVTDYFSTRLYRAAKVAQDSGAGASIRLLFPNVELRLGVKTSSGSALNLHLLCAPEDVDELDEFLALFEFEFDGRPYRGDAGGLVALGRSFKRKPRLSEEAAFVEGARQFKVSFESLRQRFTMNSWARDRCLIAVDGGSRQGASGLREPGGAFDGLRQEIERLAHVIFTSNPSDREFWLTDRSETDTMWRAPKLCLHGSDAHDNERLGVPDLQRMMWIKGDLTFETLRQACLEPASRSHIGPEPPAANDTAPRILELAVADTGWFEPALLPLNPGLIAIIGPRGSGKTALADLIAASAGSDGPFENEKSFLSRAGNLLGTAHVATSWSNGDITTSELLNPTRPEWDGAPSVRYLSQQFVDQLCAADGMTDALVEEIERVVFDSWPVEDRMGANRFRELLDLRCSHARSRQSHESQQIHLLSEIAAEQRRLQRQAPLTQSSMEIETRKLNALQRESEELAKRIDPNVATQLIRVGSEHEARVREVQAVTLRADALRKLNEWVDRARGSALPSFVSKIREEAGAAGLSHEQWMAFELDFAGDVDAIISTAIENAAQLRAALTGTPVTSEGVEVTLTDIATDQDLTRHPLTVLDKMLRTLQGLEGVDKQRTKRLVAVNNLQLEARARIQQHTAVLTQVEAAESEIRRCNAKRRDHYRAYFDALLEEEAHLRELYAPLEEILSAGTNPSLRKLRFRVNRSVDVSAWASRGEALLDVRKEGTFRLHGALEEVARSELFGAWSSGDGAEAADAIARFVAAHTKSIREQGRASRDSDPAAYLDWEMNVAKWLYSAEHVTLSYSLDYEGVDIRRLSPGTRGIVLLLLYLAIDRHESVPLLIDQPEENLDPQSVYTELVALFRETSRRRQVIMVTHNANLVVNSDVDQVIVAHCGTLEANKLPQLTYVTGGLEDPTIRTHVCTVLEGGTRAFQERARRLRIPPQPAPMGANPGLADIEPTT